MKKRKKKKKEKEKKERYSKRIELKKIDEGKVEDFYLSTLLSFSLSKLFLNFPFSPRAISLRLRRDETLHLQLLILHVRFVHSTPSLSRNQLRTQLTFIHSFTHFFPFNHP